MFSEESPLWLVYRTQEYLFRDLRGTFCPMEHVSGLRVEGERQAFRPEGSALLFSKNRSTPNLNSEEKFFMSLHQCFNFNLAL